MHAKRRFRHILTKTLSCSGSPIKDEAYRNIIELVAERAFQDYLGSQTQSDSIESDSLETKELVAVSSGYQQ